MKVGRPVGSFVLVLVSFLDQGVQNILVTHWKHIMTSLTSLIRTDTQINPPEKKSFKLGKKFKI